MRNLPNPTIPPNVDISKALKTLKSSADLTGQEWANISGIPYGTISRVLAGDSPNPGFHCVSNLVRSAHVSLDDFYDELYGLHQLPKGAAEPMPSLPEPAASEPIPVPVYERMISYRDDIIQSKDRWIRILAISLAIVIAFIMLVLLIDITDPNVGWFRSIIAGRLHRPVL